MQILSFENDVAVVTGAGFGVDRADEGLRDLATELTNGGARVMPLNADVTDEDAAQQATVVSGLGPISLAGNAAGIADGGYTAL